MVGTILVAVSALIIALIVCAIAKPASDRRPYDEFQWHN
jgi:hypothetical protein